MTTAGNESFVPANQSFTPENADDSKAEPDDAQRVIYPRCEVVRLSEDTMRIVMMGLLVGSALGVLAGTAVSAYVVPTMQVLQSYQNQASTSEARSWDI
jgi:hypothetical protein